MDCSWPGSSVHGISQVRILEWFAISISRGSCPTQGLYPGLLHCRQILYQLSYQGSKGPLNTSFKSSFKHSSRVIFLDYGSDNNIVLKLSIPLHDVFQLQIRIPYQCLL